MGCILAALFLAGCSQNNQVVPVLKEAVGTQNETAAVTKGDVFELTTYDGKVSPAVEEVTASINATAEEVVVSLGDMVKKGDVLIFLDDESLQNEINMIKEEMEEKDKNGNFDDMQKELDMEILSLTIEQKRIENAPAIEIAQLEANYAKQKLKLSQDIEIRNYEINRLKNKMVEKQNKLSHYKIVAPCDGKIVYVKEIHINSQINKGEVIFLIADYSSLHIQSDYIEEVLIKNTQFVYALIEGKEYQVEYKPYSTEEMLQLKNTETGIVSNFEVLESGDYKSGDYASICLKNNVKSNVLSIPIAALNSDGDGTFVYIANNDSMKRCDVQTGIETSIQVEIISGLKEGEQVYLSESTSVNATSAKNYETVTVLSGDYSEKGILKNLEWNFLRYDMLNIPFSKGTFTKFLVEEGAEVKKGDALISYYIPTDNILVEEKKLLLRQNQEANEIYSKQREDEISENEKSLDSMEVDSYEYKVQKLKIEKMKQSYVQYRNGTLKNISKQKEEITDLESNAKPQYIYAPYDGIVHRDQRINEGMNINNSTGLITILDSKSVVLGTSISGTTNLWFDMEISVTGIRNMKEDTQNIKKGEIVALDSFYRGKVSTGMMYIMLEDMKEMFATTQKANISGTTVSVKNVPIIPLKAVKKENDECFVHVLGEDGSLSRQYIIGRDNGVDMWVYNGLSIGQIIVAE